MEKIIFSYFLRDHSLAKEKQHSILSFSLLQQSKKIYVVTVRKG
jgi:hypothetical protein